MKLQLPKGARDFSPKDKIARQELTAKLIAIFERYGFSPLETPIIERLDILSAKYAGGEASDVMKEVFRFKDQGGRDLGLRFDLTVPLSRYVGMNPEMKMPFKRYQIGQSFRDGPIKTGRYREFWQYDIDIIGAKSMIADAEVVRIVLAVFNELGIDVKIKVNNRKLLMTIIEQAGISKDLAETVIITVDKLDKVGEKGVTDELLDKGFDKKEIEIVLNGLDISDLKECPDCEGKTELAELLSLLPDDKRVVFTPNLARGLAYYTGTVLEAFADGLNFSLAGGGRYDDMIGQYLGGSRSIPAVGLAFGFEPILEVLKKQKKITDKRSVTQLFVIPIGDTLKDAIGIADEFRSKGINTDVDLLSRGISKNIRYADSYGIPFVLFVGEDELAGGMFKLKELSTGKETEGTIADLCSVLEVVRA